jgi:hypothetical protein
MPVKINPHGKLAYALGQTQVNWLAKSVAINQLDEN